MENLLEGLLSITWQQVVMILIGLLLIYLAIKKNMSQCYYYLWDLVLYWPTYPIICRRGWRVFNLTERGRNFNGIIPYTYIYSRWGYDRF